MTAIAFTLYPKQWSPFFNLSNSDRLLQGTRLLKSHRLQKVIA